MIPVLFRRASLGIGVALLGLFVVLPAPASAQTGMVKGTVKDGEGNPIAGASIQVEPISTRTGTLRFQTTTNERGEYVQIGIPTGKYRVTVRKDKMVGERDISTSTGTQAEANFVLTPNMTMTQAEQDEMRAFLAGAAGIFDEAVALAESGQDAEAIAKFEEVIAQIETCGDCYGAIGSIHLANGNHEEAEEAFLMAAEQNPDLPHVYDGLATIYNTQGKFDMAAEASAKALELRSASGETDGDATGLFNQGVILWNSGKIPEAKASFEKSVALDPAMAEAYYWLGMANVNEGKLPEAVEYFDKYLELAPDGQYAAQAKGIADQLK
jgi:tetratricopeptide (TPR) repeat protein